MTELEMKLGDYGQLQMETYEIIQELKREIENPMTTIKEREQLQEMLEKECKEYDELEAKINEIQDQLINEEA